MKKLAKISVAVLSLSAISGLAFAAKPGFYLGAGIGGSNLETAKRVMFPDVPKSDMKQSYDRNGLAGRAFAGYTFNEYFGIEGGLAKYANAHYNSSSVVPGENYKANGEYNYAAADIVGKAYLPLGVSGFNLYALGGAAYVKSTGTFKDKLAGVTQNDVKVTTKKILPVYGVGASYDIPQSNLTTNLEYARIQGSGNVNTSAKAIPTSNLVTLNLAYNFG